MTDPKTEWELAQYQAVVARRNQWDALLWQVPVLSLTAQAFLFTIALSGGNSRTARVLASLLALLISVLAMSLMARHRVAEVLDAQWIEAFEKRHDLEPAHGESFRAARNEFRKSGYKDRVVALLAWPPSHTIWLCGMAAFGVVALVSLGIAVFQPARLA